MKFIHRFTQGGKNNGTVETFTCGCCFWFAFILHEIMLNHQILLNHTKYAKWKLKWAVSIGKEWA